MWDNIGAVKEASEMKSKQMQHIRSFFKAYKKALDNFKDSLKKALNQYEKDIIVPQSKRGSKSAQR